MSAIITSIDRENPAPCQHWTITGTIDTNPNQKTAIYHTEDLLTYGDELEEGHRKSFILMSLRRHYELGGNRAEIIGIDLEAHLGPQGAAPETISLSSKAIEYAKSGINKLLGRNNAS